MELAINHSLLCIALASAIATPSSQTFAAEPTESSAKLMAPADETIARGLRYLAKSQRPDGSFGIGYGQNVAVVALGGMAMLASGSSPGRGPYGENINACLNYLLDHTETSGFITVKASASHGPMYGHGFATLFLAEAYGMSPRDDLRDKLAAAIRLIVNTQNEQGGWRYQPVPENADLSVTICQVMALRAARNAGIHVPSETIERCIEYVRKCQNADGGFGYMIGDKRSQFPRSAAGVVALYSAGVYEGDEIESGLRYLLAVGPKTLGGRSGYFFYGHYYAVQAMWHAGGEPWRVWYPAIRDDLIATQSPNGSWTHSVGSVGPHYATAMACIILQMPNDQVPIFQR